MHLTLDPCPHLHVVASEASNPGIVRTAKQCVERKQRAHKHKLLGPVAIGTTPGLSLGQTRFVPGTNPLCPRDKPRFSPYCTQRKPSLSGFVPGTIRGTKGGTKSLYVKSLCAFFARYARSQRDYTHLSIIFELIIQKFHLHFSNFLN